MNVQTTSLNQSNLKSTRSYKTHLKEIQAKLFSFIDNLSQRVVTAINSSNEIRVWQSRDRSGHVLWHGFNPVTGSSVCVDSETEIRYWIEEQYYQY